MTDMFPTRPIKWAQIETNQVKVLKQVSEETIVAQPPAQHPTHSLEKQKSYFQRALFGRKLLVGLFDTLRKPFNWLSGVFGKKSEVGEPGKRFSWFNRVQIPDLPDRKKVYLGGIPDDLESRKIPSNTLFVSILQDFEAEHMDGKTHEFRCVVNSEDNVGMQPDEINRGVEALAAAIESNPNTPVYLHCKSGVGRSATVLAAYLVQHKHMQLEDAINLVQRDRPDAQLRGWFGRDNKHTKALREWKKPTISQDSAIKS
jgi:protein-tyrosine phosphatase